ncbi:KAP family NTPase [Laspinema olomoucense]|uniref:KAP family NTPase n=1 Tax=Laspinema olomoucense TaxID=3231600 RepID=UPI0021BAA88E|nr:KAP family NTPase [Laspinema sp. D3d]MCT7971118.1 KAP family NTPase [Laspinema sp. D3d]
MNFYEPAHIFSEEERRSEKQNSSDYPEGSSKNNHIKEELDKFYRLPYAPKFAVLLKGKWGSGKTWFINKYRDDLKNEEKHQKTDKEKVQGLKTLYISLYGVNDFSQIEQSIYKQLHPVLSSKQAVIAGKLVSSLVKGHLKIDLNKDGKDDGWNFSIPELGIGKGQGNQIKDSQYGLIIFDDIERCLIEIENILGYINTFVDSEKLKVVIIGNEEEIISKHPNYPAIKEKIIGKTFEIEPDYYSAFQDSTKKISNPQCREWVAEKIDFIKELYEKGNYQNLRTFNQVVWEFERFFNILPENFKNNPEFLQEALKVITVFSIEIARGKIEASSISELSNKIGKGYMKNEAKTKEEKEDAVAEDSDIYLFEKFSKYYPMDIIFDMNDLFILDLGWWQDFFDKSKPNQEQLEDLLLKSTYNTEATEDWVKLYHYWQLNDDEFNYLFAKVREDYKNHVFEDIGEIKHIIGLFFEFCELGLLSDAKENIFKEAKEYINWLEKTGKLDLSLDDSIYRDYYYGLSFSGSKDGCRQNYLDLDEVIKKAKKSNREKKMPMYAEDLLEIMVSDIYKFASLICITKEKEEFECRAKNYYSEPIFTYIKPEDFINKILSLVPDYKKINSIFYYIKERYIFDEQNLFKKQMNAIIGEVKFLKEIDNLITSKSTKENNKVVLSIALLQKANKKYLQPLISKLEERQNKLISQATEEN